MQPAARSHRTGPEGLSSCEVAERRLLDGRLLLRSAAIGVFSNRLLLWGIAFELALTAVLIYVPVFQDLLGTAALPWDYLLVVLPFPFIVWGADELRRWLARRRLPRPASPPRPALSAGPR